MGDDIQRLHFGASNLEDKLQDTIMLATERQRFHGNLIGLLEDFEKVNKRNTFKFHKSSR